MSTISQRDILNVMVRGDTLYKIYEYIKRRKPTKTLLVDAFSLGNPQLTQHSLTFLNMLGIIEENEMLTPNIIVDDETEFKTSILQSIYLHQDPLVNYLRNVWRQMYSYEKDLDDRNLLAILKKVRREEELSDETKKETGKLEILKPLIMYLGIVGKYSIGRETFYHQCFDPFMLRRLLSEYAKQFKLVKILEFIEWLDTEYLPAIGDGEPFMAIKRSFASADAMSLVKLSNPTDLRSRRITINSKDVSRVELV